MTLGIHSRLLGLRTPTLQALLDECDEPARAVLAAASRLARRREREESQPPDPFEPRISRADLWGAILALAPRLVLDGASARSPIDEVLLRAASTRWRARLDSASEDGAKQLGPWSRQLALAWTRPAHWEVRHFFEALGAWSLRALLPLCRDWVDGVRTGGEVVASCFDAGLVRYRNAVFPLYIDRGGLAELEAAFSSDGSLGALVIAEESGVGRHALVEAFLQARYLETSGTIDSLAWLADRRENQTLFHDPEGSDLLAFRDGIERGRLELRPAHGRVPGWFHDVPMLVNDALQDPARHRLLLITTEAELPSIASAHRALAGRAAEGDPPRLTRVFVPKATSQDWLPVWFAQLPLIEHYTDRTIRLETLLAAFASSPDAARARGDWQTVYDAILRVEVDALADLRWDPPQAPLVAPWLRVVSKVKEGRELDEGESAWVEAWLGDVACLRALITADAELHV